MILATMCVVVGAGAGTAWAAPFTVTNTGDNGGVNPAPGAGTGTLRQAIVDSNATPGSNTITFGIGTGPQTISVASELPAITVPVTINGFSQPAGASSSTAPRIDLDGTSAAFANGLSVENASGTTTIEGLEITNFSAAAGILFDSVTGGAVQGDYIGNDGAVAKPDAAGIEMISSSGVTVGGTGAGNGNVISGNAGLGVKITDSGGNAIEGNLIGTDAAGTSALGNAVRGVEVDSGSTNNTVGGTTASARNVISGNGLDGVYVTTGATGNVIEGNLIGTDATGTTPLGNGRNGVLMDSGSQGNSVGGTAAGAGNVIGDNASDGVRMDGNTTTGDSVLSNSIFSNVGVGIDLLNGANGGEAAPAVTGGVSSGPTTTVSGTVGSGSHRVQVFSNPSCSDPEGKVFLGDKVVSGTTWSVTVPTVSLGQGITATATDTTNGNTSKFSSCSTVTDSDLALANVPGNMTINPTGPTGAVVHYTLPTSTDEGGETATVGCLPASGSLFPIGTTTVTCTATDADDSNSPVTATFTVTVKGGLALLQDLLALVGAMPPSTARTVLGVQVGDAIAAEQAGNTGRVCMDLFGIVRTARQEQSYGQLAAAQAASVITAANQIAVVVGCGAVVPGGARPRPAVKHTGHKRHHARKNRSAR